MVDLMPEGVRVRDVIDRAWLEFCISRELQSPNGAQAIEVFVDGPPSWFTAVELGLAFEHGPSLLATQRTIESTNAKRRRRFEHAELVAAAKKPKRARAEAKAPKARPVLTEPSWLPDDPNASNREAARSARAQQLRRERQEAAKLCGISKAPKRPRKTPEQTRRALRAVLRRGGVSVREGAFKAHTERAAHVAAGLNHVGEE